MEETITAIGTPNIALVKYWGKRDDELNLPMNSSLSITLDESLTTQTSILFSDKVKEDVLYINGEAHLLKGNEGNEKIAFTAKAINQMRAIAKSKKKVMIVSKNSFPTSSGLASSAAGAATLVFGASKALDLDLNQKELSILARQISGSACRSLMGGFVRWNKGEREDGKDSFAEQVADEKHWPEVIDMISIVTEAKKKVSSSEGHRSTVDTSMLYKSRPSYADYNVVSISDAIAQKDFELLAEITMRDSNNMHATMLDTYPPIMYLNDNSREIMYAIHELNESEGKNVAAYTFDAGSNPQIITLKKHREKVREVIEQVRKGGKIIEAGQGSGPRLLDEEESLIDEKKLKPK